MNEPTADGSAVPRKRRSGWWFLAKLSLGLLALVVGTLWFWVRSDGDLRTARENIVATGFATTGAELGRKKSDEARIKSWNRLDQLFQNSKAPLGAWYSEPLGFAVPGSPLPETLGVHIAKLPATAVTEALSLIDGLGDDPVILDESFTVATRVMISSRVIAFLFYHALSATAADLPDALTRMARVPRWSSPHLLWTQFATITPLIRSLLYRINDLTPEQRRRMADILLEMTADPGRRLVQAQSGALVVQLDFFTDPQDRMRRGGLAAIDPLYWPVIGALYFRAGRGAFLQSELEWAVFLRDHRDDLKAICAEARRRQLPVSNWATLLSPVRVLSHSLSQITQPYWGEGLARIRLRAELVAAVLRDEPWPVDWFDPTGAKLRPITIDGKVTGAYSVGSDGVDDGGTANKDTRWALFGPIDPPKP